MKLISFAFGVWFSVVIGATAQTATVCNPSAARAASCFVSDAGSPTTYPAAAAPAQPLKLHHISLFSTNHERLAEWYRDMLGFEIAGAVPMGRRLIYPFGNGRRLAQHLARAGSDGA